MAKDPAFLFYPGDWLSGTMYLTHEQKGAYMDLLILQFNCSKFTEAQAKQVLSICFDVAWPMLKQKFKFEGNLYFNERLALEIEKRKNFTQSRRDNASGTKKDKSTEIKPIKNKKHMLEHMEDENINEDIDMINNDLKEKKSELIDALVLHFGFTEMRFANNQKTIFQFVNSQMLTEDDIAHFKNQFENYHIYKSASKETLHNFTGFLGTPAMQFQNSAWNSENWAEKLSKIKSDPNRLSKHERAKQSFEGVKNPYKT